MIWTSVIDTSLSPPPLSLSRFFMNVDLVSFTFFFVFVSTTLDPQGAFKLTTKSTWKRVR